MRDSFGKEKKIAVIEILTFDHILLYRACTY